MQPDPFEARRTGAHRLRVVTASIGAAAVVGTGLLAWSVAVGTTSASAQQQSSEDDDSTVNSGSDDSFLQPPTLPRISTSRHSHASSGGS